MMSPCLVSYCFLCNFALSGDCGTYLRPNEDGVFPDKLAAGCLEPFGVLEIDKDAKSAFCKDLANWLVMEPERLE